MRLEGPVAVLSPHLDDGIFSLGAAIAAARGEVRVVTVLAGDPQSELPAGTWDAGAGFRTAGEAAQARRAEDNRACRDLGARPVWLPFADHQYPRGGSDDEIWAELEDALAGTAAVLAPGFPLMHGDHAWLEALVRQRGLRGRRVGFYVEQPYAAAWTAGPTGGWETAGATAWHRLAKLRACRRYATQLALIAPEASLVRVARYEAARGGEAIRWD